MKEYVKTFFLQLLSFTKTTVGDVFFLLFLDWKYFLNFLLRNTFDIFNDWQSQIPALFDIFDFVSARAELSKLQRGRSAKSRTCLQNTAVIMRFLLSP